MSIRIGIDNGADGAIVAYDGTRIIAVELMPTLDIGVSRNGKRGTKRVLDHAALCDIIRAMTRNEADVFAVLEKAQPFPKEGIATSFNAGLSYGAMQMALHLLGLPYEVVPPKRWQAAVLRDTDGLDTKSRAILRVRRTFPTLNLTPGRMRKPHTGIADAACMALYAAVIRPAAHCGLPPPPPPPPR